MATIIGDSGLIGSYGAAFARENQFFFGYLSYVYLLVLLVPVFYWYRTPGFTQRRMEQTVAYVLLFFSLQILQALLVSGTELRGTLGGSFVDFLSPYIGLFGVWVFWVMATTVSVVIVLDSSVDELLAPLGALFKRPEKKRVRETHADVYAEDFRNVPATVEEEMPDEAFEAYDAPAFERHTLQHTEVLKPKAAPQDDVQQDDTDEMLPAETEAPKTIISLAQQVKEQKHALIVDELEENAKFLEQIEKGKTEKPKNFRLPSLDFLQKPAKTKNGVDESELDDKIRDLIEKLAHFKIEGDVVRTYAGPVVSTFEFKPCHGAARRDDPHPGTDPRQGRRGDRDPQQDSRDHLSA